MNLTILWMVAGTVTNLYFVKMVEKRRCTWNKMSNDDRAGFVSGIILALIFPPVFWFVLLAVNLIKKRKFSFNFY